jgi:hypothetical protein
MTKNIKTITQKKINNPINSKQKHLNHFFDISNLIETYSKKRELNEIKKELYTIKLNLNSLEKVILS